LRYADYNGELPGIADELIICHLAFAAIRCLAMPTGVSSNLDFLRATAVLLVLGQHLTRRVYADSTTPTSFLGLFGVLLFFVHTSLVLMYSMQRGGLHGRPLLKDFYIRRVFRVYPLSILAVAAALVLHLDSNINGIAGLSHGSVPGAKAIISQFLLVQNVFHVKSLVNVLWSLPFELQMYVFLPFLFAWVERNRVFWWLLALWIASCLGAWAQPHVAFLDRASLLRFVPCFLPGIIAFVLPRTARLKSFLWPPFVVGVIAAFALIPTLAMGWFLCLLLGLGIPFFEEIKDGSVRFVSHRIATYSYGIYVSHQFCIWFALGVLANRPIWLRISVLVSSLVVAPVVLYHCLEEPMIQLGIRLAARGRERPAVVRALPDKCPLRESA
jgi:peptidoglycan/LPS O-acetylase OafA/YrhL